MGKHRDHRDNREPRRRGFDDSAFSPERHPEPSYFSRPVQSQAATADAEVLWFNAEKGFGFIKTTSGTEAFLHIRALEAAGFGAVSEGAQLKVRTEQGPKGQQVSEVLEVSAADPARVPSRPVRSAPRQPMSDAPEEQGDGTVRWYNPEKGFGFIRLDGSEKDVFIHAKTLSRAGVSSLAEGQKVQVRYIQGHKGPEARNVELL